MTVLKTRDISTSLIKKGFKTRDGDHTYFILYIQDRKTSIYTKISHGRREIDDSLIKRMAGQIRLEKNQFLKLIECAIDHEKYTQILKDNGFKFEKDGL
ncbi:MAG: hypothetical protein L0H53_11465 [Candidatus Nitrosocosmicus sp.]|nr:hypothetical protein [Candidatus Nitrosocosmicus sp.]MDN5869059.1 hypothetical protein [Candidatus Nitrosocosmicus sp.]